MAVSTPSTLPSAEIKSLKFTEGFEPKNGKNVQTYPGRFPMGKSDFSIHTFEEEIEFVRGLNHSTGKNIGIYPEIKAPWFHHRGRQRYCRQHIEGAEGIWLYQQAG